MLRYYLNVKNTQKSIKGLSLRIINKNSLAYEENVVKVKIHNLFHCLQRWFWVNVRNRYKPQPTIIWIAEGNQGKSDKISKLAGSKPIIRIREQNISTTFYNICNLFRSWIYIFFLTRSKVALLMFTMQSMKNSINAKTISWGFNRGDGIEILNRNDWYLAFLWH